MVCTLLVKNSYFCMEYAHELIAEIVKTKEAGTWLWMEALILFWLNFHWSKLSSL